MKSYYKNKYVYTYNHKVDHTVIESEYLESLLPALVDWQNEHLDLTVESIIIRYIETDNADTYCADIVHRK